MRWRMYTLFLGHQESGGFDKGDSQRLGGLPGRDQDSICILENSLWLLGGAQGSPGEPRW